MDKKNIYSFMRRHRYGVVSSVSPKGASQSALVGIAVTSELEIIFDTLSSTRKYRNLSKHPRCSFVVGWEGEKTVQYEGVATKPNGTELERFQETYFAVWPECLAHLSWPGITYFVITPRWIRYSDYDQGPPLIEEIEFPANR